MLKFFYFTLCFMMITLCYGAKIQKLSSSSSNITDRRLNGYQKLVATPDMCYFCFDVLYRHLNPKNMDPPLIPNFTNGSYPLFVTWKTGKQRRLRGCVGTFDPLPLHIGLRDTALKSALQDARFTPITLKELPLLTVSVSILRHFEKPKHYLDWQLGKHGIRIEFIGEQGLMRTATFLPQIAIEQGWDKLQTIDSLLRKGGYKAIITDEIRKSIKLTRYQTDVVSATHKDYINSRRAST